MKRIRFLEWNTERCPNKLRRPTFRELYDCPKLMINRLGELKVYLDEHMHFLHSDTMYSAILWKELRGIDNKSISSSVKKFCKYNRKSMEKISEHVTSYYLLGLLNSSVVGRILTITRSGSLNIYPNHLRHIPIPIPSNDVQATIGDIAKEIVARKTQGEDCQYLEQQLDELVEQLYKQ